MHTLNYVQITHFEYHKITLPLLLFKKTLLHNSQQKNILNRIKRILDYIDVGDGCWRRNLLVTTIRRW